MPNQEQFWWVGRVISAGPGPIRKKSLLKAYTSYRRIHRTKSVSRLQSSFARQINEKLHESFIRISPRWNHFPNHGSFFKCSHRYIDCCGATNNLFVGGFKNSCRLTDVNLNNLRTINQDFYILNSIFFFRPKIWNKPVRGSKLTNPDLIGT